ncbi:Protein BFR2 [Metarhizium anisopliae]|nr:Protein BFR2 [Metarhizium anisopliae]
MAKVKGRAEQFQDPDEAIIKDHDPEANGSSSEDSEDENLGTEHYVHVGKSKLRQKESVALGPEYRGSRVSRSALDNETEDDEDAEESEDNDDDEDDYDDPDVADLEADKAEFNDSEIDSDNALGESDAERFKDYSFRGSAKPAKPTGRAKRATAADFMSGDDENSVAIQKQRKIYDGLLNLRIRLQKALVAANSFPTVEAGTDAESEPYEAAEEAAIKLLNTISSLRESIKAPTKTGEKRKRDFVASMSNDGIWEQLQDEDKDATGFRQERLEKWSKKVQSVNMARPSGISEKNKTLISALQEQLIVPNNRLVKRTRVPRSCAPAQLAKKVATDEYVYDDADFYQLLLKELVDQRTVEGVADYATAVPTVMVTATKEAKVRKQVDRKASKGRKMRFTVHEKLQNFMAPEDRRGWEQEAIDRFFGTLFGRKLELNEEESDPEEMEGVDIEEEGLKLFRN